MRGYSLSAFEKFILVLTAIILFGGFIIFFTNRESFYSYVREDGVVEWLTVLGLLIASIACFRRFFILFRLRGWWFLFVTFLLGLFLFFAAGEEISWGQRMLGIQSSEFFAKNNAQGETNLHNLVVDGVKLNRIIFTLALGTGLGIFLLLVPYFHSKNLRIRNFLNHSGVPVPRLYQVIGFLLVAIISSVLPDGKNAELLECGAALLFMLIILYPVNSPVFNTSSLSDSVMGS